MICRETQESVAVPEEMAQYILIGPVLDELQNELDAGATHTQREIDSQSQRQRRGQRESERERDKERQGERQ